MFSRQFLFLILGPVLFLVLLNAGPHSGMSSSAYAVLCTTVWMALWWVTEAVPIAVTALLPIVVFPLSGAVDLTATTVSYGNRYVFLFMGGFIIATAMQKWNLHKRIALNILRRIGTNKTMVVLGFMIATAFLSMWISNTATVVMLMPMGLSIITLLKNNTSAKSYETEAFGKTLMLGIAYSASIGGIATLIGTPPNLILAGFLSETYNVEITFWEWFQFGFPVALILLFFSWIYLTKIRYKPRNENFPGGQEEIYRLLKELGPIRREEKIVFTSFIMTAFFWITRSFLWQDIIPALDDTIIAMTSGIALFTLPAKNGKRIIEWDDALTIPWGIMLLFGGGMALANGFQVTGLAEWIGSQVTLFQGLSLLVLILILVAIVNFLTEVTSNTASTAMLLPVVAPIAISLGANPLMLLVATASAASCAFMLPAATPPNAVAFSSGHLRIPDMIKSGLFMNVVSILILTIMIYFILPLLWNFDSVRFIK